MTGFSYTHETDRVRVGWQGVELLSYVYRPTDAQVESPRPYFHPIRTVAGNEVSLYRPHDHVWHKGIAWSLSNVDDQNFWGGPTYLRPDGYAQLSNNGEMRHDQFDRLAIVDGGLRVDERLTWRTQAGADVFAEVRRFVVTVWPDEGAWQLAFATTIRNVGPQPVRLGSPTTEGRENAGYSGLFWRGPREFSAGTVILPDATGGDDLMGRRAPWLGYVGRHDGHGGVSSLLFRDATDNLGHPVQWFVRTGMYACVCPAPFFSTPYQVDPGSQLTLRYDVVVVDGELDVAAGHRLAERAAAVELAAAAELTGPR